MSTPSRAVLLVVRNLSIDIEVGEIEELIMFGRVGSIVSFSSL